MENRFLAEQVSIQISRRQQELVLELMNHPVGAPGEKALAPSGPAWARLAPLPGARGFGRVRLPAANLPAHRWCFNGKLTQSASTAP